MNDVIRSEQMSLLGVNPLSARRGAGELQVAMVGPRDGLMGVLALAGCEAEKGAGGHPAADQVMGVVEITSHWWGVEIIGEPMGVACQVATGEWWVTVVWGDRDEPRGGTQHIGSWALARWPGCEPGSAEAVIGLFGRGASRALDKVAG